MEFEVRQCVKEDSHDVQQMIKELAIYENLADRPLIDYQMIERDAFGEFKRYYIFVAQLVHTKELIGYVITYYKHPTEWEKCLWMKDLYVRPNYRHLGVGQQLLTTLSAFATQHSCHCLEWKCWDWNHNSTRKNFGGIVLSQSEGWLMFRLDIKKDNI